MLPRRSRGRSAHNRRIIAVFGQDASLGVMRIQVRNSRRRTRRYESRRRRECSRARFRRARHRQARRLAVNRVVGSLVGIVDRIVVAIGENSGCGGVNVLYCVRSRSLKITSAEAICHTSEEVFQRIRVRGSVVIGVCMG